MPWQPGTWDLLIFGHFTGKQFFLFLRYTYFKFNHLKIKLDKTAQVVEPIIYTRTLLKVSKLKNVLLIYIHT